MKIIIAGIGKIGYSIASELSKEKHNITIIDSDDARIVEISNSLDVISVNGNSASHDILKSAKAGKADLLIAVTNADEVNLLTCLIAKKLGCKRTLARVRNREYFKQAAFLKEELGLSIAVNPEEATATEISRILRFPAASKVEPFAHGKAESVEIRIDENSPLNGIQLSKFHSKFTDNILVCAVSRGEDIFIPKGDFTLQAGDRVNIIGSYRNINYFLNKTTSHKLSVKSAIILGGSKTAFYLANQLINSGIKIKIIEKNREICSQLNSMFPKASITYADGTSYDVLNEEGLSSADAFVALTGDDEDNVITSMYAQSVGVKKVIPKVNDHHIALMLSNRVLDSIIQPSYIAMQSIVSFVRSMQNAYDSSFETLYYMFDGRVENLEFRLSNNFPYTGIPLKELNFSSDSLISAIIREGTCIIPSGDDYFKPYDSVIVTTSRSGVLTLEDIMEAKL